MRLHFELSPNTEPVPFDYQHFLIGTFHKWLGKNKLHDGISLYSLSWLSNGKRLGDALVFPDGAGWFLSFFEIDLCKRVLSAALSAPEVCCGMRVIGVRIIETPRFAEVQRFAVATPVLVRTFDGHGVKHLTFKDAEADALLTQTLQTKMKHAGIVHPEARVEFDRTYAKPRTKLVTIQGIRNRASLCPVVVKGSSDAVSFAWDVGVGHSTGSGFGALC